MVKRAQYEGADMVELVKALVNMTSDHTVYDDYTQEKFEADYKLVENALEFAQIIIECPFIVDNLAELGKLPPEAKQRYLFGTITNKDVQKVEEFFKDVEMRNKSK